MKRLRGKEGGGGGGGGVIIVTVSVSFPKWNYYSHLFISTMPLFYYIYAATNLVCRVSTKWKNAMINAVQQQQCEKLCPLEVGWQKARRVAQTNSWNLLTSPKLLRKNKTLSKIWQSWLKPDSGSPIILQKVWTQITRHSSKAVKARINRMYTHFYPHILIHAAFIYC